LTGKFGAYIIFVSLCFYNTKMKSKLLVLLVFIIGNIVIYSCTVQLRPNSGGRVKVEIGGPDDDDHHHKPKKPKHSHHHDDDDHHKKHNDDDDHYKRHSDDDDD